jgi:hypothetical protein
LSLRFSYAAKIEYSNLANSLQNHVRRARQKFGGYWNWSSKLPTFPERILREYARIIAKGFALTILPHFFGVLRAQKGRLWDGNFFGRKSLKDFGKDNPGRQTETALLKRPGIVSRRSEGNGWGNYSTAQIREA